MTTTWILTANSCEAHLYSTARAKLLQGQASLTLLEDFSHPEGHLKASDLVEGKPGEFQVGKFSTTRAGYGSYTQPTDAKRVESENFAKELVNKLLSGWNHHSFEDLIVVASPGFHGLINKFIRNSPVERAVSLNVEKDYTKMRPEQLANSLWEQLE